MHKFDKNVEIFVSYTLFIAWHSNKLANHIAATRRTPAKLGVVHEMKFFSIA